MSGKSKKNKRLWLLYFMVPIVFLCSLAGIKSWWCGVEGEAHAVPSYSREDISPLLHAENLTSENYEIFFWQTGLSQAAVDTLRLQGRQQELLTLQEKMFADIEITCAPNTIVSREERIIKKEDYASIPYVEEGDILITFNSHALGWRNGHAALVVDAGKRQTLEARVLGMDSKVMSMSHWERYPSFAVLRLKDVAREQRGEIAAYALKSLTDISYRLEAGIFERLKTMMTDMFFYEQTFQAENDNTVQNSDSAETAAELSGTHCAHLIWYAYYHFG